MTAQDLQDWAEMVDARSGVSGPAGKTSDSVINAGQHVADVLAARKAAK